MSKQLPYARQTFHIALDIETSIHPPSQEAPDEKAEHYHRFLVQKLLAQLVPASAHELIFAWQLAPFREAASLSGGGKTGDGRTSTSDARGSCALRDGSRRIWLLERHSRRERGGRDTF